MASDRKSTWLQFSSLIALTLQSASLKLMTREARTQPELFISSTAVLMAEVGKSLVCFGLLFLEEPSVYVFCTKVSHVWKNPVDSLKIALLAVTYYIQNILFYVALTHLDAVVAQITYQFRVLTTAFCCCIILSKKVTIVQWLSLIVLLCGILLSVSQTYQSESSNGNASGNIFLGLSAVLTGCAISSTGSVYFEKVLKDTMDVSLWVRNLQLSLTTIPISFIQTMLTDGDLIERQGFFYGYSPLVWSCVALQVCGGLIVALVIRYADNILKTFATSFAIILVCICSVVILKLPLDPDMILGVILVITALLLYAAGRDQRVKNTCPDMQLDEEASDYSERSDDREEKQPLKKSPSRSSLLSPE